jgi:stress response protein SCP2
MESKLEKEVRLLKIYAAAATLLCAVFLLTAFASQNRKQKFEEIDVERINVVEKDGKLKMVISNKERQTPVVVDGKTFPQEGRSPGMIFFNEKGDEIGGLIFRGNTGEGQLSSLTFDKFRGDQTIAFQHLENSNGDYFAGLSFNDVNLPTVELVAKLDAIKRLPSEPARNAALKEMRERNEFMVTRLSVGKGRDKSAFMSLSDAKGKTRIKISVAADGNPKIDFLDEAGKVTYSLPEASGAVKR